MQEEVPKPTKERVDELGQKVVELEHDVKEVKRDETTSQPIETVKREAEDLTTEPMKSPRKMLTIMLIMGVALLLVSTLVIVLTNGNFLWLLAVLLLCVVLLSGRIR